MFVFVQFTLRWPAVWLNEQIVDSVKTGNRTEQLTDSTHFIASVQQEVLSHWYSPPEHTAPRILKQLKASQTGFAADLANTSSGGLADDPTE